MVRPKWLEIDKAAPDYVSISCSLQELLSIYFKVLDSPEDFIFRLSRLRFVYLKTLPSLIRLAWANVLVSSDMFIESYSFLHN